jgi:acetyl-CoA carboxylase biotin carboxyl carrier protein
MKLDLDQLREIIRLLDESGLTEIEVEHDDDRIRVRREPAQVSAVMTAPPPAHAAPGSLQPSMEPQSEQEAAVYVTSPFVGTFYRAPSPQSDPFVDVGDVVTAGQVLCIVEAMKLMNEIEAEVEGKIAEILVEDGKPVEYGDRLFRIETA